MDLTRKLRLKGHNSLGNMALSLINIPFVEKRLRERYEQAVERHRENLPELSPSDSDIVDGLKRDGVYITSLSALRIPDSDEMLQAADSVFEACEKRVGRGEYAGKDIVMARADDVVACPEIFMWGLQQRLLDIVECYLGLPVAYDGINLFYTVADRTTNRARKWHRDREDRRTVKIAVYCNDVDADGGPLQVISKSVASENLSKRFVYPSLSDRDIQENLNAPLDVDRAAVNCVGPAGTVVFCETGLHYHRGKPPTVRARRAVYFHYFSRVPRHPFFCERSGLSRSQISEFANGLPPEQAAYLLWRENLPPIAKIVPPNLL